MPYYRKRYNRYKKRGYKKRSRWGVYKAAGNQLWKDVKWLKSVVNVEYKNIDMNATAVAVSTTPTFVLLNGVATGNDSTDRNGDSIKLKSLLIRLRIVNNASATTGTIFRCMIVKDMQANKAIFAIGDLIQNTSYIMSPFNLANGKRFKVFKDYMIKINPDFPEKTINYFIRLKFHTRYGTNNATIADINTNSLYMILWSDQATNTATCEYFTRIRFIDN